MYSPHRRYVSIQFPCYTPFCYCTSVSYKVPIQNEPWMTLSYYNICSILINSSALYRIRVCALYLIINCYSPIWMNIILIKRYGLFQSINYKQINAWDASFTSIPMYINAIHSLSNRRWKAKITIHLLFLLFFLMNACYWWIQWMQISLMRLWTNSCKRD